MKSKKQLLDIANDILEQMYEQAEPPIDYHRVKDYMDHKLSHDRQMDITNMVIGKMKLNDRERASIMMHVFNVAPFSGEE
jgi:hypothetical protein